MKPFLPCVFDQDMHSKKFFYRSCTTAAVFFGITADFVPFYGQLLCWFAVILLLVLVVDVLVNAPRWGARDYNVRYEITIWCGVAVTSTSMWVNSETYILFIPMVLGVLYNSANSVLRSKRVSALVVIFMLQPIIKILVTRTQSFDYLAAMLLCLLTVLVSDNLFQSLARSREELAHKQALMKTVYMSAHRLQMQTVEAISVVIRKQIAGNTTTNVEGRIENALQSMLGGIHSSMFDAKELVDIDALVRSLPEVQDHGRMMFFVKFTQPLLICNRHIVYTTLRNVINNAVAAGQRTGTDPVVEIIQDPDDLKTITVSDDCGGFDVGNIRPGITHKGTGTGTFLSTITDPSIVELFGIHVTLFRTRFGTDVRIRIV